jgi:hypothetical protein
MINKAVREAPEGLPAEVTRAAAAAGLGAYELTWKPKFVLAMIFGLVLSVGAVGVAVEAISDRTDVEPW